MILHNHPNMWAEDSAALSLKRFEDDHGVQPITSAGRYKWEQQGLIDRWDAGGVFNRPPYLFEPKRPAEDSDHVKNGGQSFDTPNWQYWRANAGPYGMVVDYEWDVVHFRYDITKDQHISRVEEEGEMGLFIVVIDKAWWLCIPRQGGGYQAVAQPGDAEQYASAGNRNIPVKNFTNANEGAMRSLKSVVLGL